MSKNYQLTIPAHPSIYHPGDREMKVYFAEPEDGVREHTGLMLLISGYGEKSDSIEWEQARQSIADRYDVVTVQCEYFGQRFMQNIQQPQFLFDVELLRTIFTPEEFEQVYDGHQIHTDKVFKFGSKHNLHMQGVEQLREQLTEFNDMGMMQAIDNLTAVFIVHSIIKDNGLLLDLNRLFAYGHAHGAYLMHLCNAFAPDLFSLLLDNHSWMYPLYLDGDRTLSGKQGSLTFSVTFNYLARTLKHDRDLLMLPLLYKKFTNRCDIFSCHTIAKEKDNEALQSFYSRIPGCTLIEMPAAGDRQASSEPAHSPEQKLVELFDSILVDYSPRNRRKSSLSLPTTRIQTKEYRYVVDYSSGLPVFTRQSRLDAVQLYSPSILQ